MSAPSFAPLGRVKVSQRDRVLAELRTAGLAGVCDEIFYVERRLPNARNRVGELMDEGYHISSFPCPDEGHDAPYAKYVLIHTPDRICAKCPARTRIAKSRRTAPPVQMSLITE